MSILVDATSRVLIQGLGSAGKFHTETMIEYGTQVVAAAHPGKGGTRWKEVPLFDTVFSAVKETNVALNEIFHICGWQCRLRSAMTLDALSE